ncbi:multidrug efflux SMR transporter [Roseateles sp. SL47]|jgi:quaternary ammonium compound-resistance protein SugE|uniref:DMT family transporter n=1 Tax=Roseateles sp. SL47 TaxID=2995138 RepID=UPI00227098B9|nr:multidrug efflux SMR transporter [Roseateles sp. SL47]WAC72648.1 multidrug efflux SMR transporter [Roseateles sp. SL47]
MSWIYLFVAGLLEIGWPVGLKLAQTSQYRGLGFFLAAICISGSGFMLWLAQKTIPMGTAYAVWTGIGAAGAFAVGVLAYGDPASLGRFIGVGLIVAGVVTLKLMH